VPITNTSSDGDRAKEDAPTPTRRRGPSFVAHPGSFFRDMYVRTAAE
jgi:hypothetical protein